MITLATDCLKHWLCKLLEWLTAQGVLQEAFEVMVVSLVGLRQGMLHGPWLGF